MHKVANMTSMNGPAASLVVVQNAPIVDSRIDRKSNFMNTASAHGWWPRQWAPWNMTPHTKLPAMSMVIKFEHCQTTKRITVPRMRVMRLTKCRGQRGQILSSSGHLFVCDLVAAIHRRKHDSDRSEPRGYCCHTHNAAPSTSSRTGKNGTVNTECWCYGWLYTRP